MKKEILKSYNFHFSIVEIIIKMSDIIFSTISMLPKGFIKIGKILCVIVSFRIFKKDWQQENNLYNYCIYGWRDHEFFRNWALREEYSNLLLITSHIAKELR